VQNTFIPKILALLSFSVGRGTSEVERNKWGGWRRHIRKYFAAKKRWKLN